jgi:hypothetical protein
MASARLNSDGQPSRGPERLMGSGPWLIALLFAYFLIQVGASLNAGLPLDCDELHPHGSLLHGTGRTIGLPLPWEIWLVLKRQG